MMRSRVPRLRFMRQVVAGREQGRAGGGILLALKASLLFGTCSNAKRQVQRTKPNQAGHRQDGCTGKHDVTPRARDGFVDKEVGKHRGEEEADDAVGGSHVGGHDGGVWG